jgi:hypothetical protein
MAKLVGVAFGAVSSLATVLGYAVILTIVAAEVVDLRRKRKPGTAQPKELEPAHSAR